jgi:ATP-dependent protease HslVU (ClpYQ) peptidase subunit
MTTLAFDGKTLASDSQVSCGGVIASLSEQKLYILNDGRCLAGCGTTKGVAIVRKWLDDGQPEPAPKWDEKEGEFEGLIVNADGTNPCEIYSGGVFVPVAVPWVGGSGHQFALAAMHLGYTARQAIECAKNLDAFTGGPVQTIRMRKRK